MKKKLVACLLAFALTATAGISVIAATVHYNDSSVTGSSRSREILKNPVFMRVLRCGKTYENP